MYSRVPSCAAPFRSTLPSGSCTKTRCRNTITRTTSSNAPTIRNFLKLSLLLEILLLRVDPPQRSLIDMPRHETIHHRHRRQHTMILVVVLVHPVSPHQKQVLKTIRKLPQFVEPVIRYKVRRIGLGYSNHMPIRDILRVQYSN